MGGGRHLEGLAYAALLRPDVGAGSAELRRCDECAASKSPGSANLSLQYNDKDEFRRRPRALVGPASPVLRFQDKVADARACR